MANASVDSTSRMAVELDFNVVIAKDCVAAFDQRGYENSIYVTFPRMMNHILRTRAIKTLFD